MAGLHASLVEQYHVALLPLSCLHAGPSLSIGNSSGGTSHLFNTTSRTFRSSKEEGVSSTMFPSMVEIMALSELQMSNLSETLVPLAGSEST